MSQHVVEVGRSFDQPFSMTALNEFDLVWVRGLRRDLHIGVTAQNRS